MSALQSSRMHGNKQQLKDKTSDARDRKKTTNFDLLESLDESPIILLKAPLRRQVKILYKSLVRREAKLEGPDYEQFAKNCFIEFLDYINVIREGIPVDISKSSLGYQLFKGLKDFKERDGPHKLALAIFKGIRDLAGVGAARMEMARESYIVMLTRLKKPTLYANIKKAAQPCWSHKNESDAAYKRRKGKVTIHRQCTREESELFTEQVAQSIVLTLNTSSVALNYLLVEGFVLREHCLGRGTPNKGDYRKLILVPGCKCLWCDDWQGNVLKLEMNLEEAEEESLPTARFASRRSTDINRISIHLGCNLSDAELRLVPSLGKAEELMHKVREHLLFVDEDEHMDGVCDGSDDESDGFSDESDESDEAEIEDGNVELSDGGDFGDLEREFGAGGETDDDSEFGDGRMAPPELQSKRDEDDNVASAPSPSTPNQSKSPRPNSSSELFEKDNDSELSEVERI
ncbi:hypothetical protein HK097_006944 [Rhizophlyctis rosea]|uniref:Uncharacterized protein n=1 Tax=Rhizophlyctis rosea TaxID=64517 RepID=A0AAD5SE56_9FUNG|nr:hypothetical protein HK097_006944 [Rhizophlyctis rosea]